MFYQIFLINSFRFYHLMIISENFLPSWTHYNFLCVYEYVILLALVFHGFNNSENRFTKIICEIYVNFPHWFSKLSTCSIILDFVHQFYTAHTKDVFGTSSKPAILWLFCVVLQTRNKASLRCKANIECTSNFIKNCFLKLRHTKLRGTFILTIFHSSAFRCSTTATEKEVIDVFVERGITTPGRTFPGRVSQEKTLKAVWLTPTGLYCYLSFAVQYFIIVHIARELLTVGNSYNFHTLFDLFWSLGHRLMKWHGRNHPKRHLSW